MPGELEIRLAPERLDEGTREERATFGLFAISVDGFTLTEGFDAYIDANRPGPLISGYYAAEWFAWNWWRLLCEPRSRAEDWLSAHCISSIGEGYLWPNITIFSDGLRTTLISFPSSRPDAKPFRYIGGTSAVVPTSRFEEALDLFIPSILARLQHEGVPPTNLDRLWQDIINERVDPDISKRRRLEALLGRDPDTDSDAAVERLIEDATTVGNSTIGELAAECAQRSNGATVVTAEELMQLASSRGVPASRADAVRLAEEVKLPQGSNVPAWRLGVEAAHALRKQENLGLGPIATALLAEMGGISAAAVSETPAPDSRFSFAFDMDSTGTRVVLRSKWLTGRRFEIARLIGDRLFGGGDPLHPATRAHTYRQKAQRAFAAELLSPFVAVDELVSGDFSEESLQEVADRFEVSPLTVNSLLMNHGRIPRDVEYYAAVL